MIDITDIVIAAVTLIVAIITAVVIPFVKGRTTAEQFAHIKMWVGIAVDAAEQVFRGSGRGAEKKEYVVEFLRQRGIKLDADEISAMIEAEVFKLKQ